MIDLAQHVRSSADALRGHTVETVIPSATTLERTGDSLADEGDFIKALPYYRLAEEKYGMMGRAVLYNQVATKIRRLKERIKEAEDTRPADEDKE